MQLCKLKPVQSLLLPAYGPAHILSARGINWMRPVRKRTPRLLFYSHWPVATTHPPKITRCSMPSRQFPWPGSVFVRYGAIWPIPTCLFRDCQSQWAPLYGVRLAAPESTHECLVSQGPPSSRVARVLPSGTFAGPRGSHGFAPIVIRRDVHPPPPQDTCTRSSHSHWLSATVALQGVRSKPPPYKSPTPGFPRPIHRYLLAPTVVQRSVRSVRPHGMCLRPSRNRFLSTTVARRVSRPPPPGNTCPNSMRSRTLARAHCSNERCPFRASAPHVFTSHSQPLFLSH
jgi:hypothetical protein